MLHRAALGTCLLGLGAVSLGSAASARPKSLVLVGGALEDDNAEIYSMIIDRAGGPDATLCVVEAASEDPCCGPDSSWVFYQSIFTLYGAKDVVYLNVTMDYRSNAFDNATVLDQISECEGFFFGGGDQTRVMAAFYDNDVDPTTGVNTRAPSPAMEALFARFEANGGVVAGTSAGTDCQSGQVTATHALSPAPHLDDFLPRHRPWWLTPTPVTVFSTGHGHGRGRVLWPRLWHVGLRLLGRRAPSDQQLARELRPERGPRVLPLRSARHALRGAGPPGPDGALARRHLARRCP